MERITIEALCRLFALSFMMVTTAPTQAQERLVEDGDGAFYRVDTRRPAHELEAGVAADAVNKRFEDGRAWPRHGVNLQPWGLVDGNLFALKQWIPQPPSIFSYYTLNNLIIGQQYQITWNGSIGFSTDAYIQGQYFTPDFANGIQSADGPPSVIFTATSVTLWIWAPGGQVVTGPIQTVLIKYPGVNQCGYAHFSDPSGFDVTVYVTDDWRNAAGEDGGRGRVWLILPGNGPAQINLNGHDIYGVTRVIPCSKAVVLLRQDNERHYFSAAAVAASKIQLNCLPAWADGDGVLFWADTEIGSGVTGTSAPVTGTVYFVKNLSNNQVELYLDPALANKLVYTAATGRFYLERNASEPGYYGNGAPPLIAQGNALGNTLWQVGFNSVPVNIAVIAEDAVNMNWTVPNHSLIPGDSIALTGMAVLDTPVNGTYYVWPINDQILQLYDTQVHALQAANGSVTGLEVIAISHGSVPVITKTGASGLPMPPGREGFYTENNRLVIVTGMNGVSISDPLDLLHYTPFQATFTAEVGGNDSIVAVSSLVSSDALIIGKQLSVLALYNLSQGPTGWILRSITREYGVLAGQTMVPWGPNLMFLSRRGLDRVEYTAFGVIVPVQKPVSFDLKKYVDLIDWANAGIAACETWNNRLFLAVPKVGQTPGSVINNMVLTLNFLNSNPAREEFGWEGVWTGAALQVYAWARLNVFGDQRLTFVNYAGQICWLADGWQDTGNTWISDALTTRTYTGKRGGRKVWLEADVTWDTNNPLLTVNAQTPGYNEVTALTPAGGLTYDATKYAAGEGPDYNPNTQTPPFSNPYREDYSLQGPGELIGGVPDVHQNKVEGFRMREDDWGVQIVIANARGSARIQSVMVKGIVGPGAGSSNV